MSSVDRSKEALLLRLESYYSVRSTAIRLTCSISIRQLLTRTRRMTTTRKGQILFIVLNDSVKISLLQIRKIAEAL